MLRIFFSLIDVNIDKNNCFISSLSKGFNLWGWNFSIKSKYSPLCIINKNNIRYYKRRLKSIVKFFGNINIFSTITSVNNEITKWSRVHSLSDNWYTFAFELDIFLYKVFWRFVKRCHPRRPNTWIYNKYWKKVSGFWRFVFFDQNKKKNCFLKSHRICTNLYYRIPSSLNIFCLYDQKKFSSILYKRTKLNFFGTLKILYRKQQGLCYFCKRPFFFKDFKVFDYVSYKSNKIRIGSNLILVHYHCA